MGDLTIEIGRTEIIGAPIVVTYPAKIANRTVYRYGRQRVMHTNPGCCKATGKTEPEVLLCRDGLLRGCRLCKSCM